MKLKLLFFVMDFLTMVAYPIAFAHRGIRQVSKAIRVREPITRRFQNQGE